MKINFTNDKNKNMANGMRDNSGKPLTQEEIDIIKNEIRRIEADETKFIFNDQKHLKSGTCYNFYQDVVYVSRNVLPDLMYGSTHPRDIMSIASVLAHEYYGHRQYRDEYMNDYENQAEQPTTELWKDECRASITAATITPNLTKEEKRDLVLDAIFRAREYNQVIEMNDFMREIIYGYSNGNTEKNFTQGYPAIKYVSAESKSADNRNGGHDNSVSDVQRKAYRHNDFER